MVTYTVNAGVGIRDYRGKSTDEKPVEGCPTAAPSMSWTQKKRACPTRCICSTQTKTDGGRSKEAERWHLTRFLLR